MRAVCFGVLFFAVVVFAQEQTTRRPVTSAEAIALSEALALGDRIVGTLKRYLEVTHPPMTLQPMTIEGRTGLFTRAGLFTRTPTIDVLRAVRHLSDADFQLARRYHAALHPVPPASPATQPVLTMHTDRGVLVFQVSGEVALEPTK